jgi:DnaJ-domain-containing protein 1
MTSPFLPAKLVLFATFAIAVLGMLVGSVLSKGSLFLLGMPIAFFSTLSAIRQVGRYVRLLELERRWLDEVRGGRAETGTDAELPERIFVLLVTVAESDGEANATERALIRQFVLQRFPDPRLAIRLARWDVRPLERRELEILVRDLRARLPRQDRETIFHWCAVIALIDQRFSQREHDILQSVARGLGIAAEHARLLFLHAKSRVLGGRGWQGAHRGGFRGATGSAPGRDRRSEALEILGLEPDASAEQIRRRHRELVKKHHPDAHSHLGPVAQEEATERFRRVQEAYEVLTGAR